MFQGNNLTSPPWPYVHDASPLQPRVSLFLLPLTRVRSASFYKPWWVTECYFLLCTVLGVQRGPDLEADHHDLSWPMKEACPSQAWVTFILCSVLCLQLITVACYSCLTFPFGLLDYKSFPEWWSKERCSVVSILTTSCWLRSPWTGGIRLRTEIRWVGC